MSQVTGTIFQIQRFCLHDGSGIRTTVFLKGCPLRCAWCANPESQQPGSEMFHTQAGCIRCGACAAACPAGAITMSEQGAAVNREQCTECFGCTVACPVGLFADKAQRVSVEAVMDVVRRDGTFYEVSGGGMTLSGGEPLSQPAFARALLAAAKAEGIGTAIETALYAPFGDIAPLLPLLDEIFFDVKHYDGGKHRRYTGVDNALIRGNIAKLMALRPDALARVPVIPGFNDSAQDVEGMAAYLVSLGIGKVQLMRYHNLAGSKYAALGRSYDYDAVRPHTDEAFAAIADGYREGGIAVL